MKQLALTRPKIEWATVEECLNTKPPSLIGLETSHGEKYLLITRINSDKREIYEFVNFEVIFTWDFCLESLLRKVVKNPQVKVFSFESFEELGRWLLKDQEAEDNDLSLNS